MPLKNLLIERLESARDWTTGLLADIDASLWFKSPAPGVQHVAWQLGHLAASQVVIVHNRCLNIPQTDVISEVFIRQFGRGSKPTDGPAGYPPLAEIRRTFDAIHLDTLQKIRTIPEADLNLPVYGDPHPRFKTRAEAVGMAAMHESFHAGQIALTRRLFGKAALR